MRAIAKRTYSYEKGNIFAYACEAAPGQCQQEAEFWKKEEGCNLYKCKEDNNLDLCCPTNPLYGQEGESLCIGGWSVCP